MKKGIPHPSVTGMASGLAVAAYLNAGKVLRQQSGKVISRADGVLRMLWMDK